jgi:hypothetical protein
MTDDQLTSEDGFAASVAALDQMSAHMRGIAEFVSNYRKALSENGCPDDLANALTQSLHERTLALIFPSSNPFAGLFGNG